MAVLTREAIRHRLKAIDHERELLVSRLDAAPTEHELRRQRLRLRTTDTGGDPALAVRDEQIVDLYKHGSTLEEVGSLFGLSRERVRQIVDREAPEIPRFNRLAREAMARPSVRFCPLCGSPHTRTSYCSEQCQTDRMNLRYVLDDDHHDNQRKRIARVHLRSGDAHQRRFAEREIAGTTPNRFRWVRENARTYEVLRKAWENDWPVVAEFPEWLARQMQGLCTSCGEPVEDQYVCGDCHWASGGDAA